MLTLFIITLSIAGLAAGGAGLIASAAHAAEDAQLSANGQ
jgi:hypothetical protein